MNMDLPPCSEDARNTLLKSLSIGHDISLDFEQIRRFDYVVKTFPSIVADFVNKLTEDATEKTRSVCDPVEALRCQLKPFIIFTHLLGKSPQISGLMYSYFENSSFQPLQVDSFQVEGGQVIYKCPAFDDNIARDILTCLLKYLSFNPSWFGTIWNWSELGRYISLHPNAELRYLAACCFSIITKPERYQHIGLLQDAISDPQTLMEQQNNYASIFDNTFRPLVETMFERRDEFIESYGRSKTGYKYDSELFAKVTNVLLLKRDSPLEPKQLEKQKQINHDYVLVPSLHDTVSKIAYAASINKPCLIRGSTGVGKTAILDYIAAQTNRLNPPDYVKVQVGDHIDSKSLVGSYVCTDIPGQFEWQPGPMTQAMSYGSWIVFEDIDSAPSEMAQVIHSAIENGNLSCIASCPVKLDVPHPDFKIFFTQRTKSSLQPLKLGFGFVERLCDIIDLPTPTDCDLKEMVEQRYELHFLTPTILKLYDLAKESLIELDMVAPTRQISMRDLFKFCDRIKPRFSKHSGETFTPQDFDFLLANAIECFLAHLSTENVVKIAEKMGVVLNKPSSEIAAFLNRSLELSYMGEQGHFSIGRMIMDIRKATGEAMIWNDSRLSMARTQGTLQLMESLSASIFSREPVLLVGETGVGKTTVVQNLAKIMNIDLEVINLSQQSDSSDLLGGYRPVDMREIMTPIHNRFFELFGQTFNQASNKQFLDVAEARFITAKTTRDWSIYLGVLNNICTKDSIKNLSQEMYRRWESLNCQLRKIMGRLSERDDSPAMALRFSQGTLLKAVREGRWLLLDEVNLAEPDVLQCLLLVLDSLKESHVHMHTGASERESITPIHPDFRVFACMNPSTDIGKRDLPVGIRGRFTEFFVEDMMDPKGLRLIVESYVGSCLSRPQIESIVNFYREVRFRSTIYSDISGNSPVFSLRTLCRALVICSQNVCRNTERSLLESLKITFLQQLDVFSVNQVLMLIAQTIFKGTTLDQVCEAPIQKPKDNHNYVEVEGFWVQTSSQPLRVADDYILTDSVRTNLQRLCRILCLGQRKLPILIQGETSVGKTSLIKYLAKLSGNVCYRINNHEHTDLQDYIGRYVLRENGELQFKDGLLVTAMRKGYWVILDELNLAPSELLEALNRVLDDNRELYIPETGETIKAHSKFTLFATQNPPQEYAGRKLLSRAFRNRFIELHFDEIPHAELEEILQKRCELAPQYAKKIVTVMKELQVRRRESGCFGGKNSFMTIRDLFRWGERYMLHKKTIRDGEFYDWNGFVAEEGLVLLEGRVRTLTEADVVKTTIEKVFKCNLDREKIYDYDMPKDLKEVVKFKHIYFTNEFKRLYVQLTRALAYQEPVLLCGQTGCGKTTAAQLYAAQRSQDLITYNCHLNTESSDFVGNVRPSRESDKTPGQKFIWHDGPLLQAMKKGSIFLMDEISLADDAVLERINSVLEPDRSITLTELNGVEIVANSKFRLVATMNPGGDYGKKELSPALRNRFTEIYCHNALDVKQVMAIVEKSLAPGLLKPKIAPNLLKVSRQLLNDYYKGHDLISIRDVLSWIGFMNQTVSISAAPLSVQDALLHGACLVYFDQFGTCGHNNLHMNATFQLRDELKERLSQRVYAKFGKTPIFNDTLTAERNASPGNQLTDFVKFGKFVLRKGPKAINPMNEFIQDAPTVKINTEKLVRALQLDRPVLLEGDPGAGKTSIVAALARLTGHELVRINLSEQTDISDLFGSDLPDILDTPDDKPRFCWQDGPLLKAIKDSAWILLDEMNLASQSVLEGLNACFDHRKEIYIPELDKVFSVDRNSTRIFACQNPYNQGASRKGLPKSFINRFTSIYVEAHKNEDLTIILSKLYPNVPPIIIKKMIDFNNQVSSVFNSHGHEFNLRDLIYWCDLMTRYVTHDNIPSAHIDEVYEPDRVVQFVYVDRMRSIQDRIDISDIFEKVFGYSIYEPPYRDLKFGELTFTMGRAVLPRRTRLPPQLADLCILKYQMPFIESIAKAIEFNKMPILVGEAGVGKRSMVKILAGIVGSELDIIGANRDMDTIELLGSFEQKSCHRHMIEIVDDAIKFAMSVINSRPRSQIQLYQHAWLTKYVTSRRDVGLSGRKAMEAYRYQLSEVLGLIKVAHELSTFKNQAKYDGLVKRIEAIQSRVLYNSESTYSSGNFEWIDSILIKAIREGHWLMIENANLLNPATLDRLNSLVEPNGTLCLNEKGSGKDGIEILKPHPNFRLILTMSPENGELSRAMRNRGVEIFVRTRFFFEDYLMLLNQNGFVPEQSKACMTYCIMQTSYDAHHHITGEKPEEDGSVLAYFGLNYIPNLASQIRRGVNVETILSDLILAYYHKRGHLESQTDESVRKYIVDQLNEYRKKYIVSLNDSRYKWCHFRHDLATLIGGDAIPATVARERKILCEFSDPIATGLLKPSEMLEYFDIVNASTLIKIFMDYSTHVDFEYRRKTVQEAFGFSARIVAVSEANLSAVAEELLPKIRSVIGNDESSQLVPTMELYVDTRNALDTHFYLQSINYKGMLEAEDLQNRWILALHRMSLLMIVELVDENSHENPDSMSLYELSDKVRSHELSKEDLVRPHAEIAYDLHELLYGLLQVVSSRDCPNELVTKMMARTFWISYILCKLKKACVRRPEGHIELIALCSQLPMLWTLTYQKTVQPLIQDCEIADVLYNNKKFSARIKHVCDFLDVNLTRPGKEEKLHYNRIVNMFAATTKRTESLSREVEKLFNMIVARYAKRSEQLTFSDSDNTNSLIASSAPWTNSIYLSSLYDVHSNISLADSIARCQIGHSVDTSHKIKEILVEVRAKLEEKRALYDKHIEDVMKSDGYRRKCLTVNRRRCALDQFAPIWQTRFVLMRFSAMHPDIEPAHAKHYQITLSNFLNHVNGIVMSPRYVNVLNRLLHNVTSRNQVMSGDSPSIDNDCSSSSSDETLKQNIDMYTTFLIDHILENIVLDCQLVGWVKMRVHTSDLGTEAPLIPEYCPMVSLVSSYCLDISHLKLNSYLKSSPQLESMLMYLWRSYSPIKSENANEERDFGLAKNLMHLRQKVDFNNELVGQHKCQDTIECCCVEKYLSIRLDNFEKILQLVEGKSDPEDAEILSRAVKLSYYGLHNAKEYQPIFTLDPALRAREKIDVYKAELAHIKSDLYHRNALYYWRTGENLGLTEMSTEEAKCYPMSIRVLVERRDKLERSIKKLSLIFTNRPKSDDGTLYNELRKEVEVSIVRASGSISSLIDALIKYLETKKPLARAERMNQLATKCRMLIKNFERTIGRFKSDYALYSDLTTNYLAGFCLVLQGLRLMYCRLEQKLGLTSLGFTHGSINRFADDLMKVFSFNDSHLTNIESVESKRNLYQLLNLICPPDKVSYMQSLVLKASLLQLNHHIMITPSDIEKCIPIVRSIAYKFHKAWLERKNYLEEQRKKQQELYQYKTSHTSLNEVSYERQEFIDICTKFPLYDHIYQDTKNMSAKTSADRNNLETEAKIINLNRSVDLTMCIDVCKAHYKFMKQASRNLLGQHDTIELTSELKNIEMNQLIRIEAEVLYSVIRKCISSLDEHFDSLSVEYHLLQANELLKVLKITEPNQFQVGSLKSSIEILDEEIFDIYHDGCPQEALKFKDLIGRIEDRINVLRNDKDKGLDSHPLLFQISKLIDRITSFLITDPLMKFITGAHLLLSNIEEWNKSIPRDSKMVDEADSLVELIQEWRKIESKSWLSSLHRVKRKYIDDTLCDLWFRLHEAFSDPLKATKQILVERQMVDEDEVEKLEIGETLYQGFAFLIKDFLEAATLGDYQIRLDLVFAFTIQTKFAGVHGKFLPEESDKTDEQLAIDSERLTTYVYNVYRQYQGLTALHKNKLEREEEELLTVLKNEIRIVNWQGRNLWEIKTNFRCSHQKINKVMNRYLEVLRRPIPSVVSEDKKFTSFDLPAHPDSLKLSQIFDRIQSMIGDTQIKDRTTCGLASLEHNGAIVERLKQLSSEIQPLSKARYVGVLRLVEDALLMNADSIKTFYDNRVQELTIHARDSKEIRNEKLKTCRQIYHTKRFAMQAIFKNLRDLGMSYQRGLNTSEYLDASILSLEPLQGMIQNRTVSVLEAASRLVDNEIISSCNKMYRELIVNNQMLLALPREEDLSGEQLERIRGYALDMVLDIIVHNKNAAMIYRHLMDIQAAMTRLLQLKQYDSDEIYVYKFSLVHGSIKRFDRFVSRAIAGLAKVEILMECYKTYSALQSSLGHEDSGNDNFAPQNERTILTNLINEIDEENSLMTQEQYEHLDRHIAGARKSISAISSALRDKLRHTIKSHLYGDDDLLNTKHLYQQFIETLHRLIPSNHSSWLKLKRGTILGSLRLLREEAQRKLEPILRPEFLSGGLAPGDLKDHTNLAKLEIRLRKLTKQIKISAQQVYHNHKKYADTKPTGEAARRKLKPFNHMDSGVIRDLLRPLQVSKQVANCVMSLNAEPRPINIKPIITQLTPILFIYTQQIAQYLNVILCSLHTKLLTSKQLIPFFIDLVSNGFGLPCKIEELDGGGQETSVGGEGNDNVGFGDGEGDTDASKKIEFESQLDELRKNDEQEQNKGTDGQGLDTKDIEAKDDGVEMSEDFDAKAEGAGETEQSSEQTDDESDADGDKRIEELDKKFDDVDEDEGQLEQDLWDDKDEPLGEDEEADLRQVELEASQIPDMDEKEFAAMDNELNETEANAERQPESPDNHGQEENGEQSSGQTDAQMDFELISDIDLGDLNNELDEQDEKQEGEPEVEEVDVMNMSPIISETEDSINVDDVNDIDDELEKKAEKKPGGSDAARQPDESMASGSDIDIELVDNDKRDAGHDKQASDGDSNRNEASQDRDGAMDDRASAVNNEAQKSDQTNVVESREAESQQEDGDKAADEELSSKRTFANRDSLDQNSLKRQKVETARPGANSQDQNDEAIREAEPVRHIDQASSSEIVCIDLLDSPNDDEVLRDDSLQPEQIDQGQASKPKESEQIGTDMDGLDVAEDRQGQSTDMSQQQSSYNTNFGLLKFISHGLANKQDSTKDLSNLMEQIDGIVSENVDGAEHESITTDRLTSLWLDCTRRTGNLVYELCQQLQIVLQPTKMSKYRGDYKTGKRLNMRKIISYIASQYRKDKIWLRRTKPCKRTYNISLAVDNSSSMSENNCRQMTYQSLALLAKSLSLIEAGSLNVVSFGKQVKTIHEFDQPYMDAIGAQWLRGLRFDESSTSYKSILRHSCDAFVKQAQVSTSAHQQAGSGVSVNQLLIIISDGRNVTSESGDIKQYLGQLKMLGVLTLFVIIDDPKQNGGRSIVDIKKSISVPGSRAMSLENYMDSFPFPFYVILRQIETMPTILGDALRQWFELVSSGA